MSKKAYNKLVCFIRTIKIISYLMIKKITIIILNKLLIMLILVQIFSKKKLIKQMS
jgi:hypothetical protein